MKTIEDIATRMRVLASEIGGEHHSYKEAEELLNDIANELSEVNYISSVVLHDCIGDIDNYSGISDQGRFLYCKEKNIEHNKHLKELGVL